MRTVGVLAALAIALTLQTTIAGLTMAGGSLVNMVLIAVVYAALAFGPITGIFAGSAGGIAQDALSGGVIGIGGLSKTIVGFLVGVLGAQFIVSQPLPRFVMFVGATVVHELCYQGLYALVESRAFAFQVSSVLLQAVINGVIGVVAFQVVEGAPGLWQRRHTRRAASTARRRY